jgi:serine/threonine protein kinase/Tfp pilus assembly protein PilF
VTEPVGWAAIGAPPRRGLREQAVMNTAQFKRLEELFDAAVELPPDRRHEFLVNACGGDGELLHRVERLLRHADKDTAAAGLEDTARDAEASRVSDVTEPPGRRIGLYRIVKLIGEGGFGAVYEAEQEEPVRRRVALKIIKLGMDTRQVVARFEAERQALALMDHSGIARVFEAGSTETGRPYFAMELVDGVAITEYCDGTGLSPRQRLDLLMRVCDAVQHAHQKGVIHRDLKPSNVLVTSRNGEALPKVIDFGIAKAMRRRLTEKTLVTESGQLVGTPAYMSPEQAELGETDIDTRTDIYSLGALMYELLTGTTPFDAEAFRHLPYPEIRRIIREKDPPTPSIRVVGLGEELLRVAKNRSLEPGSLPRLLRGDLDWIVMRALEKERGRRYATASELAADIGRYLRHEPVLASPPRMTYRVRKFIRRHRLGVTVGISMAVALLVAVAGMSWGLTRALRAEAKARSDAEAATQVSDFLVGLFDAAAPIRPNASSITAREILDRGAEKIKNDSDLQPLVRAQLIKTMGNTYRSLALWKDARFLLEEALAIYRAELGDHHALVRDTLHDLAWTKLQDANRAVARRQLETVIEIYTKAHGPDEINLAHSRYLLANVLRDAGEHQAARSLYERVLESQEDFYGRDNVNVGWTLTNFGELLGLMADYEAARAMLERALRIMETYYGPDDLMVTYVLTDLAKVLEELGDFEQARPLFERTLAIREAVYGAEHPHTAWASLSLGQMLSLTGEHERAQRLLEHALAVFESAGQGHAVHAITAYGPLLTSMGDFDRATQLYERAVPILERDFEPNHPELAKALHGFAVLHREQRRDDRAEALFDRALEIRETVLGPDHPHVAIVLFDLAVLYLRQNRVAEAVPLLERAVAIQEAKLPPDHPDLIDTWRELEDLPR